ncbi:nucleotide disphospho-sugar-binding domain-containing protein [Streptomyces anulatus]|uniref:nucleotide disphospho-sugar-binding domain-containing protein n=1 Tax=Streptomyces anulatus TaxID=1892 RepID=UPI00365E5FB1
MRILMMTTPVPTHFTPIVPLAWAFRAAGHDVMVAGQPDVMGMVRSAGLVGTSIGERFGVEDWLRGKLQGDKRPIETLPRPRADDMGVFGQVWMAHTQETLPGQLAFAREFRPDLVVADQMEYTALIVGGVLGVPVVHHRWGVDAMSDQSLRAVRPGLAPLCAEFGLEALPEPDVKLDPCPPSLQLPSADPGTPIRHVPFNGSGELAPWARELRVSGGSGAGKARRVAVSLGRSTLALNGVPHLRLMLQAFGRLPDVEVIATVGEEHRAEIGPLPDAVRLVDPTPLHLFLGACDAVVHHGGAGTAMTATSFGLPQLVLPQLSDAFGTGEQLQKRGAGLVLDDAETQSDPAALSSALSALLTDSAHWEAARELRAEMAGMPSPARVAEDLTRLAAR